MPPPHRTGGRNGGVPGGRRIGAETHPRRRPAVAPARQPRGGGPPPSRRKRNRSFRYGYGTGEGGRHCGDCDGNGLRSRRSALACRPAGGLRKFAQDGSAICDAGRGARARRREPGRQPGGRQGRRPGGPERRPARHLHAGRDDARERRGRLPAGSRGATVQADRHPGRPHLDSNAGRDHERRHPGARRQDRRRPARRHFRRARS